MSQSLEKLYDRLDELLRRLDMSNRPTVFIPVMNEIEEVKRQINNLKRNM